MQDITINIRCDFHLDNRAECEKIMIDVAREKTQELLTTAALMAGKRPPCATIQCGDLFSTVEPVDVIKQG